MINKQAYQHIIVIGGREGAFYAPLHRVRIEACDFERSTAPISFHCILRTCLLFNQFCRNFRQSQEFFQPVDMNI